jgi:hypothetical protein
MDPIEHCHWLGPTGVMCQSFVVESDVDTKSYFCAKHRVQARRKYGCDPSLEHIQCIETRIAGCADSLNCLNDLVREAKKTIDNIKLAAIDTYGDISSCSDAVVPTKYTEYLATITKAFELIHQAGGLYEDLRSKMKADME